MAQQSEDGSTMGSGKQLRRELPELGKLLIYTSQPPAVHLLNTTSWIILDLHEQGLSDPDLWSAYHSVTQGRVSADQARHQARRALDAMRASSIIS